MKKEEYLFAVVNYITPAGRGKEVVPYLAFYKTKNEPPKDLKLLGDAKERVSLILSHIEDFLKPSTQLPELRCKKILVLFSGLGSLLGTNDTSCSHLREKKVFERIFKDSLKKLLAETLRHEEMDLMSREPYIKTLQFGVEDFNFYFKDGLIKLHTVLTKEALKNPRKFTLNADLLEMLTQVKEKFSQKTLSATEPILIV